MILLFLFHESKIVAQQGFEPSQRVLSIRKERENKMSRFSKELAL